MSEMNFEEFAGPLGPGRVRASLVAVCKLYFDLFVFIFFAPGQSSRQIVRSRGTDAFLRDCEYAAGTSLKREVPWDGPRENRLWPMWERQCFNFLFYRSVSKKSIIQHNFWSQGKHWHWRIWCIQYLCVFLDTVVIIHLPWLRTRSSIVILSFEIVEGELETMLLHHTSSTN